MDFKTALFDTAIAGLVLPLLAAMLVGLLGVLFQGHRLRASKTHNARASLREVLHRAAEHAWFRVHWKVH